MRVRVVGSGEAFDSGLGNNAFLLHADGRFDVLVDCGYQIPERLWAGNLHRHLDAVYLTHFHADHALGLPMLLTRYWQERRSRPLTIVGGAGLGGYVRRSLDLAFPGIARKLSFELALVPLRAGSRAALGPLCLETARSEHSVPNLSVKFTDDAGRTAAFSGDGKLTDATRRLYRSADLLCHELYGVRGRYGSHTNLTELESYVRGSGIGRVLVSHHAREQKTRVRRAVSRIRGPGTRWILSRPGLVLRV